MKTIHIKDSEDITEKHVLVVPTQCPVCHHGIEPAIRFTYKSGRPASPHNDGCTYEIVLSCPRNECRALFIGHYRSRGPYAMGSQSLELISFSPQNKFVKKWDKRLEKLSPIFVSIYRESAFAEQDGLLQVAGPGYRKAYEFLLKDYLISEAQGNEIEISFVKSNLVSKLWSKLNDPMVEKIAQRCAWLGNDETHYERKFEELDVQDLKRVIDHFANWLVHMIGTKEYNEQIMPRGR